jgi:cytochrome P450
VSSPDTHTINLSDPDFWEKPLADRDMAFDLLRREKPVSWQEPPIAFAPQNGKLPRGYWAITRHANIQQVHRDAKMFLAGNGTFLFDNMSLADEYTAAGMMGLDAPRHTQLRTLVQSAFTPKTLARIKDAIDRRCLELVAAVAESGSCDYREIVDPLPQLTVCDLMGFPEEDRAYVCSLIHLVTTASGPDGFDISLQASRDLANYAIEISRERAREPKDDLLTLLVQAEVEGNRFNPEDLGAMVHLIAVAGADTTAGTLHQALLALDAFPAERARLLSDFDTHIAGAIEEILRWATPGTYVRRTAREDTVVGGQAIAAGDNVVLWFRSGNRDERVFDDPYRFDITRSPNQHIAFGGGGRHFCLGHELARMEICAMLRALMTYLPDIRLTSEPVFLPTPQYVLVEGSMPCVFTPTSVPL